jgi:hypothetical protein
MQGNAPHLGRSGGAFSSAQNNTKFANFFILQQFATKTCNFTNFKMLLLAVVMDFVFLA